ncbi:MAG: RdgB/HAM1 family non-canonical purine NTP pyrophosphatase [Spirochaetes bacterium]|nr:RdgB/HAM1 family non-canonical purine NTP pyrophosphatase [Spirochaetota bacterium]
MTPVLYVATKNDGKRREIEHLLAGTSYEVRSLPREYPDIPETGSTFHANALLKAQAAYTALGFPVIADDSGLVVPSLGGAPGVLSARYAGENATPAMLVQKLLAVMQDFGDAKRSAHFRTSLVLMLSSTMYASFDGIVYGRIITAPKGTNGFGYDPVFVPNGHTATFAEMTLETKNPMSHRGMAMRKLKSFLQHLTLSAATPSG